MGDALESVIAGDSGFQFRRETFLKLDDGGAIDADQMVMMPVFALPDELEPGSAVPEIEALHDAHFFQEMHRAVNGGQIAIFAPKAGSHFFDVERMRMALQDFEDGLPLAGQLAGFAAEPLGQGRCRKTSSFGWLMMMSM
jgi:hypothetical protein